MSVTRTVLGNPHVHVLGIGLMAALAVILCRELGWLEPMELSAYDWLTTATLAEDAREPRVVLITVTEDDLKEFGTPLSDQHLADAVERLVNAGARAVGLDIYRDRPVPPGHGALERALVAHAEVVGVMKFPDERGESVDGPQVLAGSDRIGFNDVVVDPGGTVRRSLLFLERGDTIATSFALLLAQHYLRVEGISPQGDPDDPAVMRLGKVSIPPLHANEGSYVDGDAKGYQTMLTYAGSGEPFARWPLRSLLRGELPREEVADKVVMIGTTAPSVRDEFYTPFSRARSGLQHIRGVELHAHAVSHYLRLALDGETPVRSPAEWQEHAWIALWGIMGSLCVWAVASPYGAMALLAGGLTVHAVLGWVALRASWWIPTVSPGAAWLVAGGLAFGYLIQRERYERERLMRLFSCYVSKDVADVLWQNRDQFMESGRIRPQELTATVLFVDLQGFTSMTERSAPGELIERLNAYVEIMIDGAVRFGGIVDDFFGDGVKVNFGVPFVRTTDEEVRRDANNAVRCALVLQETFEQLRQSMVWRDMPPMMLRVGIATGPVTVGSIGTADRAKYTTIGDTVNLAARLEQLGKVDLGCRGTRHRGRILIAERTQGLLDARWEVQDVGRHALPGKRDPVHVFHVVSGPEEIVDLRTPHQ